ncbi:MAG: RidA family protein [Atopobiaceae bacterium]|nr:RidA family protein [Atopobiaceae bacterium]
MKYSITTKGAPAAIGPYSQGTTEARFVFISGQLGIDPETGEFVEGGIQEQTHRIIDNAEAILAEIDCDLSDVVKTTVFLKDIADFSAMNEAYAERFFKPAPARSCVQVAALPLPQALVEIEFIACR